MRFFGITIANGLSSEARVFAGLLGNRHDSYEPTVIYNAWGNQDQGIETFQKLSKVDVRSLDMGWRPNTSGSRPVTGKIASALQFRLVLPRILRLAQEAQPDIIYSCQQAWDCAAATYVAQRLNKPQVIHLHYIIGPWLKEQPLERLKTCDHVVTVSDFIRKEAMDYGISPDKITTVPNTMPLFPPADKATRVRLRCEWNIPVDAPVIAQVGRIDPGKGVDDTIRGFASVASKFSTAHLVIVGDGSERNRLQSEVNRSEFVDRILFTGRRNDIPDVLASVDIFSHPSRQDPAPLAILEAMASGLPIIAFAEGGVCDFVNSGETGFLVSPREPSGLVAAMDTMLSDLSVARRMGKAGRERCFAHFKPEVSGQKLVDVLLRVAGK